MDVDTSGATAKDQSKHPIRRLIAFCIDYALITVLVALIFSLSGISSIDLEKPDAKKSWKIGFSIEFTRFEWPLYVGSVSRNVIDEDVADLVRRLAEDRDDIDYEKAELVIERKFGLPEAVFIEAPFVQKANASPTHGTYVETLQLKSIWMKLKELLVLGGLISASIMCNLLSLRTPGKAIMQLHFAQKRANWPIAREFIKTTPIVASFLWAIPTKFEALFLQFIPDLLVSNWGALGAIIYISLIVWLWLYPLGNRSRRLLWSPIGEVVYIAKK